MRTSLCAVLLGVALLLPSLAVAEPHIFFGPVPEGETMLEQHLLEYINGATTTLDCCFFDLKSWPLTNAFVDAAKRGVAVRFVTDDGRYWHDDELKEEKRVNREYRKQGIDKAYEKKRLRDQIQALVDAGITVGNDDRSPLMHNKFCVKDGRFVWTGSYNITEPGTLYNHNNALWIESPELARIYTREFEEMFDDKKFGADSPSTLGDQEATVDGIRYEVLFAPEDNPNDRVLEVVKNATDEIYFMHYAFTHAAIGDTCVAKHFDGLKVEGIFDHLLYRSTGPTAQFNKLSQAGIPVSVVRPYKGIQHNKVFIIDPNTDHGVVVTGSLNISDSGGEQNDENTLIIHHAPTAKKYYDRYVKIKNEFSTAVVAEVLTSQIPVMKSHLEEMAIHVVTNGVPVETVSVEFPARWKISDEIVDNARIYRGTEDISEVAVKKYASNRIVFDNVHLEAKGDLRSLRIVLTDVPTPGKAGLFTLYVKAGSGTEHTDLQPIAELPTIEVFKADEVDGVEQTMAGLDDMLENLAAIDAQATTEEAQREALKQYNATFGGIENFVLSELADGQCDSIMKLVAYAEAAPNPDSLIFRAVMHKLLSLRKIVLSQSIHSDSDDLRQLATRIHDLCVQHLDDVTPLAPGTSN